MQDSIINSKVSHNSINTNSSGQRNPHRAGSYESRKEQIIFESDDYVGLPNIGNTCYINSFLINLYFCRDFHTFLVKEQPTDKTLNYLVRIFTGLDVKNTLGLQELVRKFKSTLPENFSSTDSQHDCMEFGRELIDKMMMEPTLTVNLVLTAEINQEAIRDTLSVGYCMSLQSQLKPTHCH
jgi:ubiquitin C-terminal hydrolase